MTRNISKPVKTYKDEIFVDEDGIVYYAKDLKNRIYKTIEKITTTNYSYDGSKKIVKTTKRIRIIGRQLNLFDE